MKTILLIIILSLTSCQVGLQSSYTGGVTSETLTYSTWQEINADFDGTFLIWEFVDNSNLNHIQRGVSLKYTWQEYQFPPGPDSPNPENQGVFRLTSNIPGEILHQYLFVWIIDEAGTQAVMQVYSTPEDVLRFIANINVVHQPNFHKVSPTIHP